MNTLIENQKISDSETPKTKQTRSNIAKADIYTQGTDICVILFIV